jgi:hypothetical protein
MDTSNSATILFREEFNEFWTKDCIKHGYPAMCRFNSIKLERKRRKVAVVELAAINIVKRKMITILMFK